MKHQNIKVGTKVQLNDKHAFGRSNPNRKYTVTGFDIAPIFCKRAGKKRIILNGDDNGNGIFASAVQILDTE